MGKHMEGKEVGPLVGEYLPGPEPPQRHSHTVDDLFQTVLINPQETDALRILPDIFNPDGTLNEPALRERNLRICARQASRDIQVDVSDLIWRVYLPLLAAMLIGIAALSCFI
jgi:hypothetical protein